MSDIVDSWSSYNDEVPSWVRGTCAAFAVDMQCQVSIRKEHTIFYYADGTTEADNAYVVRLKHQMGKVGSISIDTDLDALGDAGAEVLKTELQRAWTSMQIPRAK